MARSFSVDVSKWVKQAKGKQNTFVQRFCSEVSERVIERTPVDTGFARGSWQPLRNGEGMLSEAKEDPSGGTAIARANLVAYWMRAGDVFMLINNAAYIERLEYGWSEQAPSGMVRITLAEAQSIAEGILAELGESP